MKNAPMRNLAIRLVLWLCARFDIVPITEARLHVSPDAVARAERWQQFYSETGGLADMLGALRREAFEAAQEAAAGDDQTRLAWMLQDRAYRSLEQRVLNVVATGRAMQAQAAEAERMSSMRTIKSV